MYSIIVISLIIKLIIPYHSYHYCDNIIQRLCKRKHSHVNTDTQFFHCHSDSQNNASVMRLRRKLSNNRIGILTSKLCQTELNPIIFGIRSKLAC